MWANIGRATLESRALAAVLSTAACPPTPRAKRIVRSGRVGDDQVRSVRPARPFPDSGATPACRSPCSVRNPRWRGRSGGNRTSPTANSLAPPRIPRCAARRGMAGASSGRSSHARAARLPDRRNTTRCRSARRAVPNGRYRGEFLAPAPSRRIRTARPGAAERIPPESGGRPAGGTGASGALPNRGSRWVERRTGPETGPFEGRAAANGGVRSHSPGQRARQPPVPCSMMRGGPARHWATTRSGLPAISPPAGRTTAAPSAPVRRTPAAQRTTDSPANFPTVRRTPGNWRASRRCGGIPETRRNPGSAATPPCGRPPESSDGRRPAEPDSSDDPATQPTRPLSGSGTSVDPELSRSAARPTRQPS